MEDIFGILAFILFMSLMLYFTARFIMEDIFGILAFILFMSLGLWQTFAEKKKKEKKKPVQKKRSVQPPFNPMGKGVTPIPKPFDLRQVVIDAIPVPTPEKKVKSKKKKERREYSFKPEAEGVRSAVSAGPKKEPIEVEKPSHSTRVSLRSPEEARRAFIYSEIFNRKY